MLASYVEYLQCMQSFDIHPAIKVGTITGALHVADKELVCRIGDLFLIARLVDDRFVFSGGFYGTHSLAANVAITSADRVLAHWRGYVEGNMRCHLLNGGSL